MSSPNTSGALSINRRVKASVIVGLLVGAFTCFAIAPLLMPDSYSAITNAVSESAAQGVENAWLTRTGFLMLGFAVLLAVTSAGANWGIWGRVAHRTYGVAIIAAAAFSHMPWEDVPYDRFEDFLHSVAAGAVGMGFVVGVFVVTMRRPDGRLDAKAFDWFAIVASLGISMMMFNFVEYAGAMQRVMFATGIAWYILETVRWHNEGARRSLEVPASSHEGLVSAQRS